MALLVFVGTAVLSTSMVLFLRLIFERKVYERSLASLPGDFILAGYLSLLATCMQRFGFPERGFWMYPVWHMITFMTAILFAVWMHINAIRRGGIERHFTMLPAQWWHNLVVVPILSYLIISTLPIVLLTFFPLLSVIVLWSILLTNDLLNNNLVQIKE